MKFLIVFLIVVLVAGLIAAEAGGDNKKNRVCGLQSATPRLSNGNLMPIESYPWMVAVFTRFGNRTRYCSGAFITSSHVLTAAHCFGKKGEKPTNITIRYGSATLRQGTVMQVMGYYMHEDYGRLLNDIAILLLPGPVNVTSKSRSICLPGSPSDVPGTRAIVTGWGTVKKNGNVSRDLGSTSQVLWSPDRCRVSFPGFDPQRQICAKVANTGPCKGDSGGPLMIQKGANFEVVGIVSHGSSCDTLARPEVYTKVWHFLPWIQKALSADSTCRYKKPQ